MTTSTPNELNAFRWAKLYFQNEDRDLTATKSTMAALFTYADFHELTCYPSQATLARVTALDVQTVRRHLRKNVEKGWLGVIERGNSYKKATRYRLSVPEPLSTATAVTNQLVSATTPTGIKGDRSTPIKDDALTTNRTTNEPPIGGSVGDRTGIGSDTSSGSDKTPDPFGGPGIDSPSNATTQTSTPINSDRSTGYIDDDPWGTLPDRAVEPEPASVAEPVRPKPVPKPDCCDNVPFCSCPWNDLTETR
ncbi:helix-turn-helix domain-containing protein [Mycobacteroides abscessus]|uniref:helix-turn-helix domain-containing protein n=2 Tax=Mycobacteroides abscessus TaxID=36809 RepID=UPI0005E42DE9|nr:hypothetical protein B9M79_02135 [Mycobacteroides abscessus]RTZ50908.1 helix-turn-helix domain-containing protein [Mycobacteroides abscessus subsp. abscessus]PVA25008.1 helix-turn-helix domain-containing protein [Mycobacteroides abscessus]PVB52310.1 helix-turn-helix domain-containing protein [Mycobacteroides abscessus]RIR28743.1 helix-turn-helix domain-containing protein [Mycobacteroides abscessus]